MYVNVHKRKSITGNATFLNVMLRYVMFGRYVTLSYVTFVRLDVTLRLNRLTLCFPMISDHYSEYTCFIFTLRSVQYSNVMYMTLQYVAATFYVTQHCFCYSPTISPIFPSQVMHWLEFKFVPIAILLFATTKSIMAYMEEYMW